MGVTLTDAQVRRIQGNLKSLEQHTRGNNIAFNQVRKVKLELIKADKKTNK